jgi:uncharacterized protein
MNKKRLAVVGGGVSGLVLAWLMRERFAVTLFEAADYLGGHTHTVDLDVDDHRFAVDTGFLVFNTRTYPNLLALFARLGVPSHPSDMGFSLRVDQPGVEWSGSNLNTVFGQRRNLLSPAFWRMLCDILRLHRQADVLLQEAETTGCSLGDLLRRHGFGRQMQDWYLLPMAAAIWSCPTATMLDYPAASFLHFCRNHGLLQVEGRPQWLTVPGGARQYVEAIVAQLDDVRLSCPIQSVERYPEHVVLRHAGGEEIFDQVVLAGHAPDSLALLQDANADEQRILQAFRYQPNHAVLHTDIRHLPRRRKLWSAWNFMSGQSGPDQRPVAVSYWLNRLQPLPVETPIILTLNPLETIDPDRILGQWSYAHPVFDQAAVSAQALLPGIQGGRRTWFAGAWTRYGFHEDGVRSALNVARGLGVEPPWEAVHD